VSDQKDRTAQICAVISTASVVSHGDQAEAIAVLLGAITMMCARSLNPIATIEISIDSLAAARDICTAHMLAAQAKRGPVH